MGYGFVFALRKIRFLDFASRFAVTHQICFAQILVRFAPRYFGSSLRIRPTQNPQNKATVEKLWLTNKDDNKFVYNFLIIFNFLSLICYSSYLIFSLALLLKYPLYDVVTPKKPCGTRLFEKTYYTKGVF